MTELGARRRAAGERRAARTILRDAHDAAHACRASALCERARAELLLAGGRPRPAAGAGVDALTPAERRVADIAASGATNREIARRLYLSPKTVEMHLRSAYRKLELPGRGGLATRCTEKHCHAADLATGRKQECSIVEKHHIRCCFVTHNATSVMPATMRASGRVVHSRRDFGSGARRRPPPAAMGVLQWRVALDCCELCGEPRICPAASEGVQPRHPEAGGSAYIRCAASTIGR